MPDHLDGVAPSPYTAVNAAGDRKAGRLPGVGAGAPTLPFCFLAGLSSGPGSATAAVGSGCFAAATPVASPKPLLALPSAGPATDTGSLITKSTGTNLYNVQQHAGKRTHQILERALLRRVGRAASCCGSCCECAAATTSCASAQTRPLSDHHRPGGPGGGARCSGQAQSDLRLAVIRKYSRQGAIGRAVVDAAGTLWTLCPWVC